MDFLTVVLVVVNLLVWPALGVLALRNPAALQRPERPPEPTVKTDKRDDVTFG